MKQLAFLSFFGHILLADMTLQGTDFNTTLAVTSTSSEQRCQFKAPWAHGASWKQAGPGLRRAPSCRCARNGVHTKQRLEPNLITSRLYTVKLTDSRGVRRKGVLPRGSGPVASLVACHPICAYVPDFDLQEFALKQLAFLSFLGHILLADMTLQGTDFNTTLAVTSTSNEQRCQFKAPWAHGASWKQAGPGLRRAPSCRCARNGVHTKQRLEPNLITSRLYTVKLTDSRGVRRKGVLPRGSGPVASLVACHPICAYVPDFDLQEFALKQLAFLSFLGHILLADMTLQGTDFNTTLAVTSTSNEQRCQFKAPWAHGASWKQARKPEASSLSAFADNEYPLSCKSEAVRLVPMVHARLRGVVKLVMAGRCSRIF